MKKSYIVWFQTEQDDRRCYLAEGGGHTYSLARAKLYAGTVAAKGASTRNLKRMCVDFPASVIYRSGWYTTD